MRTVLQGMTTEGYQALAAGVFDKFKSAPGFIAHASGPIEGGYYVTEFWESQEAHAQWVRDVIAPTMQQLGGGQPPQVRYLPAENAITR
jgi:hypothetical protein